MVKKMKMMKKAVLVFAGVLVLGQTVSMTAMAHGHGRGHHGTRTAVVYSQCNVDGCNVTTVHEHDGEYCYGHTLWDGHDYHQVCDVEGCTEWREHEHDGVCWLPHSSNDGHSYHHSGHCGGHRRCR